MFPDAKPGTNPAKWDIETTDPLTAEKLRAALREVTDPELGLDIIALGLVRNVSIQDDLMVLQMMLTTPFCPYGPAMMESTRQKAEEVLNRPVHIDFLLEAWDFSYMEEGVGADWGLY